MYMINMLLFLTATFDVQGLLVSEYFSHGINVSIVYVEGTLSPGALVCVLPINDGVLDVESMKLVTIPRSMSDNYTIPVPSGEYRVVAFDLESHQTNNMLSLVSMEADSEDIKITTGSEGMYIALFAKKKH